MDGCRAETQIWRVTDSTALLTAGLEGRYRVERELGAGGMATVYLARDLRHDRLVALKVLHPELAAVVGAERFLQEIRVTANLQHPHILPLHDSGRVGGDSNGPLLLFFVMPFVEGETLRARITREKQLPLDTAVEITRGIASALAYAHRQGVIHRDIKPENILLHDGQPLVADFGIALAVSAAGQTRLTETGLSIGTPQYMSPEQSMGDRTLDGRTDIYSLACVLFEMLAGEPPFTGATAQAVVAKVLTERPPLVTATRSSVPPHVTAAIDRALSRLPADRFQGASEFAEALVNPRSESWSPDRRPVRVSTISRWARASALVAAAAIGALGYRLLWRQPARAVTTTAAPIRFEVVPRQEERVGTLGGVDVAISRDGRSIVYAGLGPRESRLYLRRLDRPDIEPVPDTEGGLRAGFSPDGSSIAFYDRPNNAIRVTQLGEGRSRVVTPLPPIAAPSGVHWATDGNIYYDSDGSLYAVSPAGGQPRLVAAKDSLGYRWPELLPDGKTMLVTRMASSVHDARIEVLDLESGKSRVIIPEGSNAHYLPTGHLVYGKANQSMLAVAFDADAGQVRGAAVPVLDQVEVRLGGATQFAISQNGTVVYIPGTGREHRLVLVDLNGREEDLPIEGMFQTPRFSPDGRRVAYAEESSPGELDLFVYELGSGAPVRLTSGGLNVNPTWSPDGRSIAFSSTGNAKRGFGISLISADGRDSAVSLLSQEENTFPHGWFRNGRGVLFASSVQRNERGLVTALAEPRTARVGVIATGGAQPEWYREIPLLLSAAVSPDGRWIAYASEASGVTDIFVQAYPATSSRWKVSTGGGAEPVWSPDGKTLYYRTGGQMYGGKVMAAHLRTDPTFSVLSIETILEGGYVKRLGLPDYDIDPSGRRFVMIRPANRPSEGFTVVGNWLTVVHDRMSGSPDR